MTFFVSPFTSQNEARHILGGRPLTHLDNKKQ